MASNKNFILKKKRTVAFLFPSLMAAFKNEILMGMAQYAQRQRNIGIRCIEEDDVDDKSVFAECDGIFTNTTNEEVIGHMTATGLPIVRFHDDPKRPDMIDIGFDTDGNPSVRIPKPVNTEGAALTVQATEDLADWSDAKLVPMAYDDGDGTWKPADGVERPAMFFRWRVNVE